MNIEKQEDSLKIFRWSDVCENNWQSEEYSKLVTYEDVNMGYNIEDIT